MKGLAIVFILLAVPAAIQCKDALTERQGASISDLISGLFGPGGALAGQQGLLPFVTQLLNNVVQTVSSQPGIPGKLDPGSALQSLLNSLLKNGGTVQQLLTSLGGNPDALKGLLVFLLGPNGIVQALLGPNGIVGQLLSGKPLNLPLVVNNLLTTLLSIQGLVPGLLNVLLGPNGLLNSGAIGNLLKPLTGQGGLVTNLLNGLGLPGTDTVGVVNQLLQNVLGILTGNNPQPIPGVLGGLLTGLLTTVKTLTDGLGLTSPTSGGGSSGNGGQTLQNLLQQLQQALKNNPNLLNELLKLLTGQNNNGNPNGSSLQDLINTIKNVLTALPNLLTPLINQLQSLLPAGAAPIVPPGQDPLTSLLNYLTANPNAIKPALDFLQQQLQNGNGNPSTGNGTSLQNLIDTIKSILSKFPNFLTPLITWIQQNIPGAGTIGTPGQNPLDALIQFLNANPNAVPQVLAQLAQQQANATLNPTPTPTPTPTNPIGPNGPKNNYTSVYVGPKGIIGRLFDGVTGLLGKAIVAIFNALFGQKGLANAIGNVLNGILKQTGLDKPAADVGKFLQTIINALAGKGTILGNIGNLITQFFNSVTSKSGLLGTTINAIQKYLGGPKGATVPGIIKAILKFILLLLGGNLDVSTVLCKLKAVNPTANLLSLAQPCLNNVTDPALNAELVAEINNLNCATKMTRAITSERATVITPIGNLNANQLIQLFDFNQCIFDSSKSGTAPPGG